MIRVAGLRHRIGGVPILHDVDLVLEPGGVTALIGPNGAGKSTLLSLIARLQPLQTGRIEVDDLVVGVSPTDALARRLAILPQRTEIAPRLSVRQLVAFGRYPHHKGRAGPPDLMAVEAALERFDLTPLADRMLDTLSGGQRQRALVAMIFAQAADYLLLDEPLNNLDIAGARGLMAQLRTLARTAGRTILIVLHDINYAAAYADRIVAMRAGRIVASGPPADVITAATLHAVFDSDAAVETVRGRPVVLV
ncbi:MAG: ATP-binding cassette domain-containing protein [Pseudomonadota bacterium]